jgi:uncharacterized membrane protein
MSNLTALALIMAILVAAQLSIFWCARKLQDRADGIATGVIRGVPISTEHRGVVLFNQWMPMQFFLAVYTFLISIGMVLVAQNISSGDVRLFAYVIAAQGAISALGLIVLGGLASRRTRLNTPLWL